MRAYDALRKDTRTYSKSTTLRASVIVLSRGGPIGLAFAFHGDYNE